MPRQKDLKRVVRARMQKTGESYTAARLQLVRKKEEPKADLAKLADDLTAGLLPRLAPGDLGQFLARLHDARGGFQAPG